MDEDSLDPTRLLAAQSHLFPGKRVSNEPDLAGAGQGQDRSRQGGNSTLVPGCSCSSLLPEEPPRAPAPSQVSALVQGSLWHPKFLSPGSRSDPWAATPHGVLGAPRGVCGIPNHLSQAPQRILDTGKGPEWEADTTAHFPADEPFQTPFSQVSMVEPSHGECPREKNKMGADPSLTEAEIPDFGCAWDRHWSLECSGFWEQEGTHHVFQVFWSEGGQLQLQLTQALEAIQEILEKDSGLIHQQPGEAIW